MSKIKQTVEKVIHMLRAAIGSEANEILFFEQAREQGAV
jgi:hypothetical protein